MLLSIHIRHIREQALALRLAIDLLRRTYQHSLKILPLFTAVLLASLTLARPASAQREVSIRFLDFESGKPIKKLGVMITGYKGDPSHGKAADSTILFSVSKKTDQDGRVVVQLTEPLPDRIHVYSFDLAQSLSGFSPAEVLKAGSVVEYRDNTPKLQISAKPGEILILNRKLTAWDKMRREIP